MGVPVVEVSYIYSPFLAACSKYNGDDANTLVCDRFLENTIVIGL
jgi:hypothetical protein